MRRRGLTLLEILVALAILAVFTAALMAFTQNTLATNRIARTQAQLMEELKDAAGYLADTLQEAKVILSSAEVNSFTCTTPDCLVALIPTADPTKCDLRAYRLQSRGDPDIGDDYKSPNSWADANTRILREYRREDQSCSATAFSGAQPYLVIDLVDNNLSFFAVLDNPPRITLNIRLKTRVDNQTLYIPSETDVYTITVYPRNAQ